MAARKTEPVVARKAETAKARKVAEPEPVKKTRKAVEPEPVRKARKADPVPEPVKRKSVVKEVEKAPAVQTEHKSGKSKVPEFFMSPEFLSMSKMFDKADDKAKCQSVYLEQTGYLEYPVSTGLLAYDLQLGGGLAGGRVHVEYGAEKSGKTSRCMTLLGNSVVDSVMPFYYDAETALDPSYTDRILKHTVGLTLKELQGQKDDKGNWLRPQYIRYYRENMGRKFFLHMHYVLQALPDIEQDREGNFFKVYRSAKGSDRYEPCDPYPQALFLEDSVAALNPSMKGDVDDENNTMAALARLLSWGFPMIKGLLGQKNAVLFMTNQLRNKPAAGMSRSEYMPGGSSFYHNNDMRAFTQARHPRSAEYELEKLGILEVNSGENFSTERSIQGGFDAYHYQRIKIEKNKYFMPDRQVLIRTRKEHNGAVGDGICETFDTYQYLRCTGQITVKAKKLTLNVDGVSKGKKIPDLYGANGQVIDWMKFKELVEDRKTFKESLRLHCQRQISTGHAFALQTAAGKNGIKTGAIESSSDEDDGDDD